MENKFRGMADDGIWWYGNLIECKSGTYILEDCANLELRPEYRTQGIGCGIEDKNIQNRYEAAEYGWQKCYDNFDSSLPNYIPVSTESVGRFIKINGIDYYEGDILNISHDGSKSLSSNYEIKWSDYDYGFILISAIRDGDEYGVYTRNLSSLRKETVIKLIGNRIDNPELVKIAN